MEVETCLSVPIVRWRPLLLSVLGAGLLVPFAGCHRAPGADVVATVNNKDIMRADLEKLYKDRIADNPQQPSPEQADILRLSLLRGMIDDEIIQQRAAKQHLAASDEDVNAQLTELKALDTEEEFNKKLQQRGLTVDDLKRDIRRNLTRQKLLNKEIESKINITDAEIASFYNSHKSEFNNIEPKYHLGQILVTGNPPQQGNTNPAARQPNEAEARKEIQSVRNRLQSGEDFGTLASQLSENTTYANNGGDMGSIPESDLKSDPEVFKAIGGLKVGQITEPLPVVQNGPASRKVIVGYQVLKLLDREAAGQRQLNDPRVQQFIRQGLRSAKSQLLQNAYYEVLHDEAKVRNYFAEQVLKQGAQ